MRVVNGVIWDSAAVLGALAGDIDLTRPVCLIMTMVLHFLDAESARSAVSGYLAELAPGSYLVASVGHGQGEAADTAGATAAPSTRHAGPAAPGHPYRQASVPLESYWPAAPGFPGNCATRTGEGPAGRLLREYARLPCATRPASSRARAA